MWKFPRISNYWLFICSWTPVETSRRMLIGVRCAASIWGLPVCFRSLLISCFFLFFLAVSPISWLPSHTFVHTLLCLHASERRQEDVVSGTAFFLESRNGSEVQIWTRASPWRWSRNKLVSVIAKAWASLLTVTLTSVLHREKQIRLSAAVIRLIMSQRQHCVYVPLL